MPQMLLSVEYFCVTGCESYKLQKKKEIRGSAYQQINRQLLLFASYPLVVASYLSYLAQGSVNRGASFALVYLYQFTSHL